MARLGREHTVLLVLAVLLVISGSFYFFYAVPFSEKKSQKVQAHRDIIEIPSGDIIKMEIGNRYGAFTIVRSLPAWKIVSPVVAEADNSEINSIVSYFEELEVRTGISKRITKAERTRYGLDIPRYILAIWQDKGSRLMTLHLGDITPDGMGVYAYRDDIEEIVILPMYLTLLLDKNLYDLREKSVFKGDIGAVRRVEIVFAKNRIVLSRSSREEWVIEEPLHSVAADGEEVRKMLHLLAGVNVIEFYDETGSDLGMYGLDDPWAKISWVRDGSNEPDRVSFGFLNKERGLYARKDISGEVLLLPLEITALFIDDIYTIRDKSVFSFRNQDVTGFALRYRDGERDVTILRKDSASWTIVGPEPIKTDTATVGDYFSELRSLRVARFLPFESNKYDSLGLEDPAMTITVEREDEPSAVLRIGDIYPDDGSFVFARMGDGNEVLLIDKKAFEIIQKPQGYFQDRHIFQFDIGKVNSVELLFDDVETYIQRSRNDKWQVTVPKKGPINRFPVLLLLRELWRLKSLESVYAVESEGLGRPEMRIEFFLDTEGGSITYTFWHDRSGGNREVVKVLDRYYAVADSDVELIRARLSQIVAQVK
jgi:hypothetical protein